MASLLEVQDLTKSFGGFCALNHIDLVVHRGERLGLIGPNGSGKTTLINCITGVLRPDRGRIYFDGEEITSLASFRIARAGIARSFQIPRPFRSMTVLENLCIPLRFAAAVKMRSTELEAAAREILELIGLGDKATASPLDLTQIEMRKMELSRALASRPRLLILDEVMAGLASSELDEMLAIFHILSGQGITIIMIEHILRAVMNFSQRLVVLDAGRKIADGSPGDVIKNPQVEKAYLGE